MAVDTFLLGFAYLAGVASFFSPCSVGLLPAYVGYFLGTDERTRAATANVDATGLLANPAAKPAAGFLEQGVLKGAGFGLMASLGFFGLFLGVGVLVSAIGTGFLGPYLVWISRVIGVAILLLGILLLSGKSLSFTPRIQVRPTKSIASLFAFGLAYGLASLGCTLPVFLSVVLGSFSASTPLFGFFTLAAYATGMATFMVLISILLGASREATGTFLQRVVPYVKVASAVLMVGAGAYILYYYTVVIPI